MMQKGRVGDTGMTIFLCGDVMTGRGIDQVLPNPSEPQIFEPYIRNALGYVELAERANGPIPSPVDYDYIWGDALAELDRVAPDLRIINLETAVTTSEAWSPKGINYRMHPANVPCLSAAGIDGCVLANNHVLDWGIGGLVETLETLHSAGLHTTGAGRTIDQAAAPAILGVEGKGRVLVFAFGVPDSGTPSAWAAGADRPGVNILPDLSRTSLRRVAATVERYRGDGDLVVVSLHWGPNWGYRIDPRHRRFAHALIDEAGVDVVYGHSSHHPKGIEVHHGRLILYGCGDLLNDYEGISGHEAFRGELGLMYFATLGATTGELLQLQMTPTRIRRLQLTHASRDEARWMRATLDREGKRLGTSVDLDEHDRLRLGWR
jgi:poly-gamma-glutamate synthesis protein (capsule biosynthesis protein)